MLAAVSGGMTEHERRELAKAHRRRWEPDLMDLQFNAISSPRLAGDAGSQIWWTNRSFNAGSWPKLRAMLTTDLVD